MSVVYLNGEFMDSSEAQVSVMDRGFLFGDGVYEVIPVFSGKLFRIEEHLKRLSRSLKAIRIEVALDAGDWTDLIKDIIFRNGGGNLSIYLQVTRGVEEERGHAFPNNPNPTIFIMANPLPGSDNRPPAVGKKAITVQDIRWQRCDIKAIALLANVLHLQQALDAGADEAILQRGNEVVEGAASNLFIVKNNTIITPPKDERLLGGVTRDLILELSTEAAIPITEQPIALSDLYSAQEVWLTSSTRELVPIIQVDFKTIADGKVGPIWHKVVDLYCDFKKTMAGA